MIVCLCHRVSDRDIVRVVRSGAHCFELLQDETRVATSCGRCDTFAREVFHAACAQAPQHVAGAAQGIAFAAVAG